MKDIFSPSDVDSNKITSNFKSTCFKFNHLDLSDLRLMPARIDIWQYPLHTIWSGAHALLNKSETERAKRYYFSHHQSRFTIAHAMLRLILSRYIKNTKPNAIEFTENYYGKPEILLNPMNLQFNLSHSGDLALLVIGTDYPVGIDLEFFSARSYIGIGAQMFAEAENNALIKLDASLQALSFFHIWAQKEAFIKACGLGLSYPTKEFEVPHLPTTNQPINDSLNNNQWHMTSFMPKIACSAAVCHNPSINNIRYISLESHNDLA